jgi:hypothetical protein
MNFERTAGVSLHIFFSREGREMNTLETRKRASIIVGDKSILAALGLQCSCNVQCRIDNSFIRGKRKQQLRGRYKNNSKEVEEAMMGQKRMLGIYRMGTTMGKLSNWRVLV